MNREEWIEAKRGMISASNAHKLLGSDGTMNKYVDQLIYELDGGEVIQSGLEYGDKGLSMEPIVIGKFITKTNDDPDEPHIKPLDMKIIRHQDFFFSLCSPDMTFVDSNDERFGLEVKCKFDTSRNHDKSWRSILQKPNKNNFLQCQYSLWCAESESFDRWVLLYTHIPLGFQEQDEEIELLRYEITPDQEIHERFEDRAQECWSRVEQIMGERNL